ncbi:hypothetical protein V5O48_007700 [Marasmius crinis-equi]|uniref:F-box domain-containing protein n=1 Tax=Marasmius crinis-equi TaxID=585013 RepID=A0ABR3FG22_9AGAR
MEGLRSGPAQERSLDFPDEVWDQVLSNEVDVKGLHAIVTSNVRLHLLALPTLLKELQWKNAEAFRSNFTLWERASNQSLTGLHGRLTIDTCLFQQPTSIVVGDPLNRPTSSSESFNFPAMFRLFPSFPNLSILCFAKIQIPFRTLSSALSGLNSLTTLILIDVSEEPRPLNSADPVDVYRDRVSFPRIRHLQIEGRYSITPFQTTLITVLTLFSLQSIETLKLDWFAFRSIWTHLLRVLDPRFPTDLVFDIPTHGGPGARTVRVSRPPRLVSFTLLLSGRVYWGYYGFEEPHRAAKHLVHFLGRCGDFLEQLHIDGWVGGQYGFIDRITLPLLSTYSGPMHLMSYIQTNLSPLSRLTVSPSVHYENELTRLVTRVGSFPRIIRFEIAFKSLTTSILTSVKDLLPNLEELFIFVARSTLSLDNMLAVGQHVLRGLGSLQVVHLYAPLSPALDFSREETLAIIGTWSRYTSVLREVRLSGDFYFFKSVGGMWTSSRKVAEGWEGHLLYGQ